MFCYLVQHGKATSKDEDPERPLTNEGRAEVQAVLDAAAGRMDGVARIVHSGKLRASETAELIAARLGVAAEQGDNLAPNADPVIWRERLDETEADTVLVGHLPHLSHLAGLLLCGRDQEVVRFRNAGIACLGRDEEGWAVRWVAVP